MDLTSKYKIMVVDDEVGIIDTLSVILKRRSYSCTGFVNPLDAVEELKREHYDLLILDYLMNPIHGDKVVEMIREFDKDIYILLLTGHKDLAPPLETIKSLEIQGYCEKSDKFDQLLLLIESAIKSIEQMRTINKFKNGLNKIFEAAPNIYKLQPLENLLQNILIEILFLVNGKNAFILIENFQIWEGLCKNIYKGIGKYEAKNNKSYEDIIDEYIKVHIDIAKKSKQEIRLEKGIILPISDKYIGFNGVIYVEGNEIDESSKLLNIFINQASISLSNVFLHELVNRKNQEITWTFDQLKANYVDTIEVLRQAVDAKDVYTRGHSDRVAYYAVEIGNALELPESQIELLRISGIFHDIGKIGVPDSILLNKTGKLTESEYNEIKKHPVKSAQILSAISRFKDIVPVVKYHHERIDGKGYPEGLKGDQIPFLAKILAVADSFDAMISDRLYRPKLSVDEAKKQLIKGAGTQFDKDIVDIFIKLLDNFDRMASEIADTYCTA